MNCGKKLLNVEEIDIVEKKLEELYSDAKAELNFTNPFELLIATILSAQCTDVRVNIITEELFKVAKTPKDIIKLGIDNLEEYIRTCGLSRTKSKNIYNTCLMLENEFGGNVPNSKENLIKLPGVGIKTANVVLSNAFNVPAIAVDTHVQRVSNRLGIVDTKKVKETEEELMKKFRKEKWTKLHHQFIYHGRRICKSRKPKCDLCTLNEVCLYYNQMGCKNE